MESASDTESDDESLYLLHNFEVVISSEVVEREAKKIADQLGQDSVPDAMKEGKELEGTVVSYDQDTTTYQVEVKRVGITFSLKETDFVVKEDRDKASVTAKKMKFKF